MATIVCGFKPGALNLRVVVVGFRLWALSFLHRLRRSSVRFKLVSVYRGG